MFGFSIWELLIVLVILLMFFGVGKLPEVFETLGTSVKNFQKGLEKKDETDEAEPAPEDEKELEESK